jgi:hypothetical protein
MYKNYPRVRNMKTQVFAVCGGMKTCCKARDGKTYPVGYLHLISLAKDLGRVEASGRIIEGFFEVALLSENLHQIKISPECDYVESRPSIATLSRPLALLFYERKVVGNGVSCKVSFLSGEELLKDWDDEFARLELPCQTRQVRSLIQQVGEKRSQVA